MTQKPLLPALPQPQIVDVSMPAGISALNRLLGKMTRTRWETDYGRSHRRVPGMFGQDMEIRTYGNTLTLIDLADGPHHGAIGPLIHCLNRFLRRSGDGTQIAYQRFHSIAWLAGTQVVEHRHARE